MSLRLMFHPERAAEKLSIIRDNDSFFMTTTINKLDETLDGLTKHAENAVYVDEAYYENADGIRMPWHTLSIGSKTVLNVFYNPELCFDQIECNSDACANLKNLTKGCITPGFIVDKDGDDKCDVIVDDDPSRVYTEVSKIHAGSGLTFTRGSYSLDLTFGFNVISDMTATDKEYLVSGIKCYEGAPIVKHIATKSEYQRFLSSSDNDDCNNMIIFLDRFALFGNNEILNKCRDFKKAVVLLECTGFVDKTFIQPRAMAKVERQGRIFKIYVK